MPPKPALTTLCGTLAPGGHVYRLLLRHIQAYRPLFVGAPAPPAEMSRAPHVSKGSCLYFSKRAIDMQTAVISNRFVV